MPHRKLVTILMADDDMDDREFARTAMQESRLMNELRFVEDGEDLLDYLYRRGAYSDPKSAPRPGLILLDLNMPRKDGREALREIKADPSLRSIPVVVLTTSRESADIATAYGLGVNSYLVKPVDYADFTGVVHAIKTYWLRLNEPPFPHHHV